MDISKSEPLNEPTLPKRYHTRRASIESYGSRKRCADYGTPRKLGPKRKKTRACIAGPKKCSNEQLYATQLTGNDPYLVSHHEKLKEIPEDVTSVDRLPSQPGRLAYTPLPPLPRQENTKNGLYERSTQDFTQGRVPLVDPPVAPYEHNELRRAEKYMPDLQAEEEHKRKQLAASSKSKGQLLDNWQDSKIVVPREKKGVPQEKPQQQEHQQAFQGPYNGYSGDPPSPVYPINYPSEGSSSPLVLHLDVFPGSPRSDPNDKCIAGLPIIDQELGYLERPIVPFPAFVAPSLSMTRNDDPPTAWYMAMGRRYLGEERRVPAADADMELLFDFDAAC